MRKIKNLNFKINVKGLDEYRGKLDDLGGEFEKLINTMGRINDLVDEINQMELIMDIDRDRKNSDR